jgi:hypothetical protein
MLYYLKRGAGQGYNSGPAENSHVNCPLALYSHRDVCPATHLGLPISLQAAAQAPTFTCAERAAVGSFRIPIEVLLALPPSGAFNGVPLGSLTVTAVPIEDVARFTAPGLDAGYINYNFSEGRGVAYQ